jgi:membrane fusion protein (multidrug efflux system)
VVQFYSHARSSRQWLESHELNSNHHLTVASSPVCPKTAPWFRRLGVLRIAAPLVVGISLSACKKPEVVAPPPPIVEVMEIVPSEVQRTSILIGQLDSPQNVEVRARVEGFVDRMPFTEGVEVKQGDVLFELDKKPFLERLAAATGALAEAKAALYKYQKDVARVQPLVERKAIPQQDLDLSLIHI